MTQPFDPSGSNYSSDALKVSLVSQLYSRNWAPTAKQTTPFSSVSLLPSSSGAKYRKRSLSPASAAASEPTQKGARSQANPISASSFGKLHVSVSSLPPPSTTEQRATSSTDDNALDIFQEADLLQSRLRSDSNLHHAHDSLLRQRASGMQKAMAARGLVTAQSEVDEIHEVARQMEVKRKLYSTMPLSTATLSTITTMDVNRSCAPFTPAQSSAPRAPPTTLTELFSGEWNTVRERQMARAEADVARALKRQTKLVHNASRRRRSTTQSRREKLLQFASSLDVRPARHTALGLTEAFSGTPPLYAQRRKMPLSPCDRDGCAGKTRTITGVCKAHPCIFKGCDKPQNALSLCREHENAYYYCTRIKY